MHIRQCRGKTSKRSARATLNLCNSDCTNARGRSLSTEVMHCKWIFKQYTEVLTAAPPCLAFSSSCPALQFEDTGVLRSSSLQRN
ncbi:hypothetical protein PFLUV_G00179760 [Perca fluviatilis]|uniref:Uncharacterized protein n=1 Tax=Perca fluviatilis TaxID=8168 RepID=A0A6A5ELE0_PERFL|nr:hypothetical protein PFLUV_G00179760 [Perca fluviatilis]